MKKILKSTYMIFKITYQPTKRKLQCENTEALYIEANDKVARRLVDENTEYNVEFIQEPGWKHWFTKNKTLSLN